jgi:acetylornithine deacetylase/succinyl-diaminopimelate desuccinylase-like protein
VTSTLPFDNVVELFLALAEIDGPSLAEQRLLDFVTSLLRNARYVVRHDFYGNLVASHPSVFDGASRPVVFTCHADMVSNGKPVRPRIVAGKVVATGGNCLGADNKASLACLLWVMLQTLERPVELVVSRNEENGFIGARSFDPSLVRSRTGVNLDGTDASEIAVSSLYWYQLEYAAEPTRDGLADLARRLDKREEISSTSVWLDPDTEIPVVGVFTDSTSSEPAIHELAAEHASGDYRLVLRSPGYSVPVDDPLVRVLSNSIVESGLQPRLTNEKVGTEGCIYNAKGIKMVTTGVTISGYHTPEETVAVDALRQSIQIIEGFIREYTEKNGQT